MIKLYKNLLLFAFALLICSNGWTQSNTMYYMGTTPQAYYLNPATQPGCKFYLGFPGASPLQFGIESSGFSANDLFWYDSEIDSIIHPLYSANAAVKFLSNLKDIETINLEMGINLASFGFRAGEMYFSFDATLKSVQNITYPKDLVTLIAKGNEDGQAFDFSSLNINLLSYMETGINISRRFSDELTIGIRPKILYGLATLNTSETEISLQTSSQEWVLRSKFNGNMAITGLSIPLDSNNVLDPEGNFEFDSTITDNPAENWNKLFSKNRGLGIDLGIHYKPMEQVQFSLSLLDLGYIKWRSNPHVITQDGSFTFRGIEWNPSDSVDYAETILDTLKSNLSLSGSGQPFRTNLNPKLIVGGRFFLAPGFDVGLLSRTEFRPGYIDQNLILLANFHPFKALSISGSYSLLGKTHSNFGLGLGLKLGPLNFYAISDYNPFYRDELQTKDDVKIPVPVNLYQVNVRVGLNLVFGCNQDKQLKQDKPLFNSTDWMF